MKYESIAREWFDKRERTFENFLESVNNHEFKKYDLTVSGIENYETLSQSCKECIFQQIKKYRDYKSEDGESMENKFVVECNGFPEHYINPKIFEKLGVEPDSVAAKNLLTSRDPVAWAELNAFTEQGQPWIARKEQEIMLRCTSNRVVYRCGRRVGKSDALVVNALFNCIVLPGRPLVTMEDGLQRKQPLTILFITPRQSHSDNLWRKLEAQLQYSKTIKNSIESHKRYPYIDIQFKNGSKIFIMTAGTGGANAGLSLRSFSADILVLDEGNYLGAPELKAATAILMTNKNCKLIVSSTPMGIHDFFYEWCFMTPGYKEFHFPTIVLPHWEEVKQSIYQDCQTVDDFLHEFMAEFSPPGHNVFRMDLIQKALRDYSYEHMQRNAGSLYGIGVDWNSNAGTEIIVTCFDPVERTYMVVDNINVSKSEWTQLKSCNVVLDAVKKWRPQVVVVDEGYGATQVEILRAVSMASDDPDINSLGDILISYNFASKIEIVDPITRRPVKKAAKPFLVKNAVTRFEEENIWISQEDRLLYEQLSLYAIKSISVTGSPIYWVPRDDVGDHRLDAFMLSLIGFKMKFSNLFGSGSTVSDVGFIASQALKATRAKEEQGDGNPQFEKAHVHLYTTGRGGNGKSMRPLVGRRYVS